MTSRRAARVEVTLGLVALALVAGAGVGLAVRRNTPVEPGLVVEPADLDFGTVWEQPAYRHTLVVRNPTDRVVRVAKISAGCKCTQIEPQSFIVPPRGKQAVVAALDLGGLGASEFLVDLFVQTADRPPDQRVIWTLRGQVRPNPIRVEGGGLDFDEPLTVGEPFPSGETFLNVEEQFARRGLRVADRPDKAAEVTLERVAGEAERYRLAVRPSPSIPPGSFEFDVRVAVASPGSEVPHLDVPVRGRVRLDVEAWPPSIAFGGVEVGRTAREYLTLSSHAGRPFTVTSVGLPDGIRVTPDGSALDGAEQTFVVEQNAASPGHHEGMLRLRIDAAPDRAKELRPVLLTVPISCDGVKTAVTRSSRGPSASASLPNTEMGR
jgi:hypothetical protein